LPPLLPLGLCKATWSSPYALARGITEYGISDVRLAPSIQPRPDGSLASWRSYGAPPLSLYLLYVASRRTCDFRSGCVQVKKKVTLRSFDREKKKNVYDSIYY
jgi:hypothetical protein